MFPLVFPVQVLHLYIYQYHLSAGICTFLDKKVQFQLLFEFSGGAGGKGTWGKPGCELELPWVDPNDPNYESSDENNEEEKKKTKLKTLVPEMSEEDVRKAVEPLILEYFENSDTMEVQCTLQVSVEGYLYDVQVIN